MTHVSLTVNGVRRDCQIENHTLLVELLRERLRLTGTHVSCDTSQCGACVVLVDGAPAKSCTTLAVQVDGSSITTIEGVASADALHPVQQAMIDCHGLQCGFCTPGMVMSAIALLERNPDPSEDEIVHALEGNFCRCTGYANIVAAVREAAARMPASGALQGEPL